MALMKKLRKAKKEAAPGEKPECVKTHLRDMIIVPEMIGSVIGIYNGKVFSESAAPCHGWSDPGARRDLGDLVADRTLTPQTPLRSSPR